MSQELNRISRIKEASSQMMHLHYCENDVEAVLQFFGPQLIWIGAGEDEYAATRKATVDYFHRYQSDIPRCEITQEEYDVMDLGADLYLCAGRMWISTAKDTKLCLQVHQRITFLFRWEGERPACLHIHCSNPYLEMLEGEHFPHSIGKQSYAYVQARIQELEKEAKQKNRQLEVIMSSIPGGLKISRNDEEYSFEYVTPEAAAIFGYTVEEFLEMSGGTAVGVTYPPDRQQALRDCEACFQDGSDTYALKYRVQCKDGSLKWILDSGKKSRDEKGNVLINSLYLDITKAEQDALEIMRQRELLQSIYDTVPCGILRFARKGTAFQVVSLNQAALYLLSYDDEQACIEDWRNGVAGTVLEEDVPLLRNTYNELRQVGDKVEILYRIRRQDGGIRWLSGNNVLLSSDSEGDVIQRIIFDVTESKRLQDRLALEQELYRVAMESSSDILYEYLPEEDILVVYEPQWEGDKRGHVTRKEFRQYQSLIWTKDVVHPDDIPAVIDNICKGRAEIFEARFRTPEVPKGEQFFWYRVTGKVIANPNQPRRVVGTFQNIHREKMERTADSQALHRNQSALQAISGVYAGIYYADLQEDRYYGVRIPEFRQGADYPRQGSLQADLSAYIEQAVCPEDRPQAAQLADLRYLSDQLHAVGDRVAVEFRVQSGASGYSWIRLETQLISVRDGRPWNVISTFRNVTEERRRELERHQEESEAKHALEEAYATAKRANLAKSDFLSKMSHDMRTPMNAILGMTAIAEQHLEDPDKMAACLGKIQTSSRHLLNLINEVLDMAKIEQGGISLEEGELNLRQVLQNTADMVRVELESKGQTLQMEIGKLTRESVLGDAVRIQQILLNLLTNAVKYTPEQGHIRLGLREKSVSSSGIGCYEFIVGDDGIGMSAEFQNKVFEPFVRAEDSRVSQVQGTGLGLAITKNLVQMMNGDIQMSSKLNVGTLFTVTVPLKILERQVVAPRETPAELIRFQRPSRVLLVEDNSLNREIAAELLESAGLVVEQVEDGRQALERFQRSAPGYYQLILMDIQMPVMNGYEATMAIRSQARSDAASIPIIALTANAFAEDVSRARQAGMNEHLSKPVEVAALLQTLQHYLPA